MRLALEGVGDRVLKGLDRAKELEVGRGYFAILAGVNSAAGAFARAELGARPLEPLEVFGYAQVSSGFPGLPSSFGPVAEAGVGARLRW